MSDLRSPEDALRARAMAVLQEAGLLEHPDIAAWLQSGQQVPAIPSEPFPQPLPDFHPEVNESFWLGLDTMIPICKTDVQGRLVFVNALFCQLSGYEKHELIGSSVEILTSGVHEPELFLEIDSYIQQDKIWRGDICNRAKDGSFYWIDCMVIPQYDARYEARGTLTVQIDISERKRSEQDLHESRKLIKSITDTIPNMVYIYDVSLGRIIYCNQRFEEVTGYSGQELFDMGRAFFRDVFHNEDAALLLAFEEALRKADDEEVIEISYRLITRAGHTSWLHTRVKVFRRHSDGRVMQVLGISQDISQIKEIEHVLMRQESLYKGILEYMPAEVSVLAPDGSYRFVNPYGFADPELRRWIIGKNDEEYLAYIGAAPGRARQRHQAYRQAMEEKRPVQFEEEWTDKDGLQSYLRSFYPVVNAHGQVEMLIGCGINITEWRRAERQLAQQESRYKYMVENATDILYQAGPDGKLLYFNSTGSQITGYPVEELMGMHYLDLIRPDYRERVRHFYEVEARQNSYLEFPILTKSGEERWIGQNVQFQYRNEELIHVQALARDITEHKHILEELQASRYRLKEALRVGRIGGFDVYEKTQQVVWSEETFDIFGFDPAKGAPSRPAIWRRVHPDDHDKAWETITAASREAQAFEVEFRYLMPDGSIRHILSRGRPVSVNGEVERLTGIIMDITARKEAEELSIRAKQLTEEAVKIKELFLANISHELRTPMNGIIGMANLLLRTPLEGQQLQFAQVIKDSAENLEVVLSDILDFTKIGAGKIRLESIPFSLSKAIRTVVQTQSLKALEKGIELRAEPLPKQVEWLQGDPYRLNQILLNLLNNAVKFTMQGSVALSVEILSSDDEQIFLRFSIRDTGIGIPEDKRERIFEDFVQAYNSTTREHGGTGLGLTISQHLANMMGGQIHVESDLGQGSHFYVELPFLRPTQEEAGSEQPQAAHSNARMGKGSILLVEDNPVNQLLTRTILENRGFRVTTANHGEEALELLQQQVFDLILMDIQMPVMDGIEATQRIRRLQDEKIRHLPIIAYTAQLSQESWDQMSAYGMSGFLAKPFKEEELFEKIFTAIHSEDLRLEERTGENAPLDPAIQYSLEDLQRIGQHDPAFIVRMIHLYFDSVPLAVERIIDAARHKDPALLNSWLHKIKPTLQHLRMHAFYRLLAELEQQVLAEGEVARMEALFTAIHQQMEQLSAGLTANLEEYQAQVK